jgi:hypothetical protein
VAHQGARAANLSVQNVSDQVGVGGFVVFDQAEEVIHLGRRLVGGKSLFEGSACRSRGATPAKRVPQFVNQCVN